MGQTFSVRKRDRECVPRDSFETYQKSRLTPRKRDAVEKKEMIPVKDFLSSSTSIYNKSWMITPGQVISWMLRQLGVTGGVSAEDKLSVGNFVLVANVEVSPLPKLWILLI